MTELPAIISALNLVGLGGVGIFIYYLFKGLSQKIKTLTEISKEQEKTLAVVRDRAIELEKWREEYKKMITDFQEIGGKLDTRRNELVRELEDANKRKDQEVSDLKSAQIKEIELRQKSFHKIQQLEKDLKSAKAELDRQMKILQPWGLSGSLSTDVALLSPLTAVPFISAEQLWSWPDPLHFSQDAFEFLLPDSIKATAKKQSSPDGTKDAEHGN